MTQLWGCASLNDCGWTGQQPGRNKEGTEFCPNCGGFVAQRGQPPLTPDLTDEQIRAGLAAANSMDSTFDHGDGSTAAERETACIDAFRRATQLPEWENYQLEGIGIVRRRKPTHGVLVDGDQSPSPKDPYAS